MLRKLILKIHLYGGLLCFWYLIIFAVSSLHFQHKFSFMSTPDPAVSFVKSVNIKPISDLKIMANDLKDSLDIPGWYLFWETSRDSLGAFRTSYQNPKANYQVVYHPDSSYVKVTKTNYGFWRVVNSLHGFGGNMPNGSFIRIWGIYTYVCIFVLLFSIISGIWLWATTRGEKLTGWITFGGILIFSLVLILLAGFNG